MEETDVIDEQGNPVKVDAMVSVPSDSLATMEAAPTEVLMEAQKAAAALQDVIKRKPRPVVMNGEQYLEFEDWQTLGRFYGITAREDGDAEFVQLGDVQGFKASALAVDRAGRVLSRATAFCLNDEEKWSTRTKYEWLYVLKDGGTSAEDPGPDRIAWEDNPNKPGKKRPKKERVEAGEERVPMYQLASMAQTRAAAKALRNVLSWVAVLAGYKPTPAEEMPEPKAAASLLPAPDAAPQASGGDAEAIAGMAAKMVNLSGGKRSAGAIIAEHSAFTDKEGKSRSFSDPFRQKSAKWLKSTRTRMEKALLDAEKLAELGDQAPIWANEPASEEQPA